MSLPADIGHYTGALMGMTAVLLVNIDIIPSAQVRLLLGRLIVAIHVLGWLWLLLWTLGLGGVVRFVWQSWRRISLRLPAYRRQAATGRLDSSMYMITPV